MAKSKTVKAEKVVDESGLRTRRYPSRKGYAERIPKKKVKINATDDATENIGADSAV